VHQSDNMPWYDGPPLLDFLESVPVDVDHLGVRGARFPVQFVIRPMSVELPDYRGYAGTLATGALRAGDEVVVLPSGRRTTVAAVETADGPLDVAVARQAITVRLADEVDVSRGDLIAAADDAPTVTSEFEATVCWMHDAPLVPGRKLALKHTTRSVKAIVTTLVDTLDVTTLESGDATSFGLNDIGRVIIRTSSPIFVDDYIVDRTTGAFVLIDEATGATVAAGMVGTTLGAHA
jgi:sulfate adenylyltransferase subunit 1 (EFTu-like GTPase family)